jgi:hypothetical protein
MTNQTAVRKFEIWISHLNRISSFENAAWRAHRQNVLPISRNLPSHYLAERAAISGANSSF